VPSAQRTILSIHADFLSIMLLAPPSVTNRLHLECLTIGIYCHAVASGERAEFQAAHETGSLRLRLVPLLVPLELQVIVSVEPSGTICTLSLGVVVGFRFSSICDRPSILHECFGWIGSLEDVGFQLYILANVSSNSCCNVIDMYRTLIQGCQLALLVEPALGSDKVAHLLWDFQVGSFRTRMPPLCSRP